MNSDLAAPDKRKLEQSGPTEAASALKDGRDSLIGALSGLAPVEFLRRHARLLDDYFQRCFESSTVGPSLKINANPFAIIALGGFGRREQCMHSDVDLLFLFEKKIPTRTEGLIREVVYPLWDIGMDVGYAVRTVRECLSLSRKDFESLTPLLDARFVCGMSTVASRLGESLREKVLKHQQKTVIKWLVETNRNRHHLFGDSSYLLEPNLKEGQGGLRDYHTLLWIARILFDLKEPRDLEYMGCLSHREYLSLRKALDFIWNVRNRLHLMSGRKWDHLIFEYQMPLAEAMGFKKTNGQEPVEIFLSVLHGQMDFIKQQHLRFFYEQGLDRSGRRRKKPSQRTRIQDLSVENDMLFFASPEAVLKSPQLLIQIFEESARLGVPLSGEARRLIQELSPFVARGSRETLRSFERILCHPGTFNVLKEMLESGFLTAFLPEIKGVVHRIQYDAYHLYPVDFHLLQTVEAVLRFAEAADDSLDKMIFRLYSEIQNRRLLFWAALLHDIGKGTSEGDHAEHGAVMARRAMEAVGCSAGDSETVAFLVKEHLFLMKTATRRDLQDEETAIFCARRIKDPERLKMLYLLTVADSIATGPKAWTSWTAAILKDLFLKTLRILEKGELASSEVMERVKNTGRALVDAMKGPEKKAEMTRLLEVMSPRYLISVPMEAILGHVSLFLNLGESEFVWEVSKGEDPETREVTLCAKDRPGLFSKIAGAMTLNGIDILDAQAFTWKNKMALDIFTVKPPPDLLFEKERWERARKNLEAALSGTLDLSKSLEKKMASQWPTRIRSAKRPLRITVDNSSSSFFTLIEVVADDFPGLLYRVSDAILRCNLDIWVAKISTKVDQVVDVFYVRDLDGQKVDSPDQEKAIRQAIKRALQQPLGGRNGT